MAAKSLNMSTMSFPAADRSLAELIDELSHFDGEPEQFLSLLLVRQCQIAEAAAGVILRYNEGQPGPQPGGEPELLAIHPSAEGKSGGGARTPVWLSQALEMAPRIYSQAVTLVVPLRNADQLYEEQANCYLVMAPLLGDSGVRGAEAFLIESDDVAHVNQCRKRIELTVSLLRFYEMRLTVERSKVNIGRLGHVVEVLAAMNQHDQLLATGMELCNQVAARWKADRVSLGFLHNRSVRLCATSHASRFTRKMKLIQAIESAMEECVDQDLEILYPATEESTYLWRAAGVLSQRYGPTCVLSLPMRRHGDLVAVLTIERPWDRPFKLEPIETLRLLCDVATPRLMDLHKHDRWFGAKIADAIGQSMALLVGAQHTWAKLAATAVLVVGLVLIFARGEDHVESSFALEASHRRIVPAPFGGYLASADVSPGDQVTANRTVLARIDTVDLNLKLAEAEAKYRSFLKDADIAKSQDDKGKSKIALADADRIEARIKLMEQQINHAVIRSPITGVVLVGELKKSLGGPVTMGQVLFEVAPLKTLRAALWVSEDRIADVQVGQVGALVAVSHPGRHIRFVVEKINPVAEVSGNRNVFRVQARLLETELWMRPGMEGIAKVEVGRCRLGWIFSRSLVNWIRMKLWI